MQIARYLIAGTTSLTLTTTMLSSAIAQDREPKRMFGGHSFVPMQLLGDPFVGTYVRNATGGGTAAGLTLAVPDLDGGIAGFVESDIGFLVLELEYQQNVTNWLALRVGANGGARLGTSVEALLSEGVTAVFSYNFGLSAQIVRSNRFLLSVSADIIPNKAYGISLLDFARSVAVNDLDSASSLLTTGDGRRIFFGLRPALGVTDWLGIQGLFDIGPGEAKTDSGDPTEAVEQQETQTTVGLGVSINRAGNVPIGFSAAYQHKNGLLGRGNVSGGADTWNVGIYYTGHHRFIVGLDITSSSLDQVLTDNKINLLGVRLTLRYDFR